MSETPKTESACLDAGGKWDAENQVCKMPSAEMSISSSTVKTQLAKVSLENREKEIVIGQLSEENAKLKQQNIELATVIENDLKADLAVKIMAASTYQPNDLANMSVEQMQSIHETLSNSKGYASTFKTIRAGNASQRVSRLTVGDLYGKTREQINQMEVTQ